MKVTVCFGSVRVVVPCSDGNLTIADLTDRAVLRFLKATRGSPTRRIYVQKLIASSDGGILDPSDRLKDVVDDRDQIIALFEEHVGTMRQHSGGDGISLSSQSASSPEMFPDDHVNEHDLSQENFTSLNRDVFISTNDLITSSNLIVRRESEPVLSFSELVTVFGKSCVPKDSSQKPLGCLKDCHEVDSDSGVSASGSADRKMSKCDVVNRVTKPNSPCNEIIQEKEKWNAENVSSFCNRKVDKNGSVEVRDTRITPPPVPPRGSSSQLTLQNSVASNHTNTRVLGKKIVIQLIKGSCGLGFSVTTRDNPTRGTCPIYIKNILPQGAAVENGQLRIGDRLLQVNGTEVTGKSQSEVVSLLRSVPMGSAVELVISRQELVETNMNQLHGELSSAGDYDIPVSTVLAASTGNDVDILVFDIRLNSSEIQGLGITLKGRTVSTPNGIQDHGIFIKSMVDGGAAQKDGRLQQDDQLCEVNGQCLLNQSNLDATNTLRSAICLHYSSSGYAKIIVARRKPTYLDSKTSFLSNNTKELNKIEATVAKSPGADFLTPVQTKLGSFCPPASNIFHNLSYQQAINDTVSKGIFPEKCSKSSSKESSTMDENTADKEEVTRSIEKNNSCETLDWDCKNSDVTLETSSSDADSRPAFQREGFGRQSMSEKRKAHLDPRHTEVYQKIKLNKSRFCSASLDRAKTKPKQSDEDTSLEPEIRQGCLLKKMSASYESLQAAFQEPDQGSSVKTKKDTEDNKDSKGRSRGVNNSSRGVNNSFRAAVDRSFEDALDPNNMSINENDCIDFSKELNENTINSKDVEESQTFRKEKSSSIFKGLGGILRFGRNKKSDGKSENAGQENVKTTERKRPHSAYEDRTRAISIKTQHQFNEIASRSEPLHIPQGRKENDQLISTRSSKVDASVSQKSLSSSAPLQDSNGSTTIEIQDSSKGLHPKPKKSSAPSPSSRLIQLRHEQQQQHRERRHQYPLDAEEDRREKCHRELELQNQEIGKVEQPVQMRKRPELPGSRVPYLERPTSLGSSFQNTDLIHAHHQQHDNGHQHYKLEIRRQQQHVQHLLSQNQQHLQVQKPESLELQRHKDILEQQQQRQRIPLQQSPCQQSQLHQESINQRQIRHQYSHSYSSSQSSNFHRSSAYQTESQYLDYHTGMRNYESDYFFAPRDPTWRQPRPHDTRLDGVALDARIGFENYGQTYYEQRDDMIMPMQLNQMPFKQVNALDSDSYSAAFNLSRRSDRAKHYYH